MSDVLNEDDLHSIKHTGIAYNAIPPIHIQPKGGGIMRQAWLCTWVFPSWSSSLVRNLGVVTSSRLPVSSLAKVCDLDPRKEGGNYG